VDSDQSGSVLLEDGCSIAYRLEGDPAAPTILLSNSLGTAMDMWAPQIAPLLAAGFRILRYDTRGHGASDVPVGAYSMDRLGRDVIGLLDALGIERVHYCGLSLGGMVGQWLGYRAPERLQRLILANTAAYMGPPSGWQGRIDTVLNSGTGSLAGAVIERWFTPEFAEANPEPVQAIRILLTNTAGQGYAGCCAAIRDMDLRPVGPLIPVPTLVIGGTRDPATPLENAKALAQAIPAAELAMLDAAHLSNVEQADAFTKLVTRFLNSS
jgi:3-oxoadipate enol-lactonase